MLTVADMDADVAEAREQFGYGTVIVDGRRYAMREDWVVVADRAAAKFGSPADPDEPKRYARALAIARQGVSK